MSRVGAGLVGIDPSGTTRLHPAMTLTAPVVQVRRVRAGTPVGYGHTHRTAAATHLGLVPLGYADGLPRARLRPGRGAAARRRRPVVGRISMDQLVVDLGAGGGDPGETVMVFGPGETASRPSPTGPRGPDTIEHEIVTGIGARVQRRTLATPHLRSLS